jgi:hypothetical protein
MERRQAGYMIIRAICDPYKRGKSAESVSIDKRR